jgi:hypothetical protein
MWIYRKETMSLKELQTQNQKENECKTSKRERKKKFSKFKDVLHKNFGNKNSPGMGECKPLICTICGERIYSCISEVIGGKIHTYCDKTSCRDEISKLKRGVK